MINDIANKPWEKEVDAFTRKYNSYHLVIQRHPSLKHLCGYVGVSKMHPLYGKGYEGVYGIDVHGGLTYANEGFDKELFKDGYWYFGFDCAHMSDLVPAQLEMMGDIGIFEDAVYRDFPYVNGEVNRLMSQLKSIRQKTKVNHVSVYRKLRRMKELNKINDA